MVGAALKGNSREYLYAMRVWRCGQAAGAGATQATRFRSGAVMADTLDSSCQAAELHQGNRRRRAKGLTASMACIHKRFA
jgi:hypothetical protein